MRSIYVSVIITSTVLGFVPVVIAKPIQTLKLYPGHGTTLNFRTTGETIYKTWLDDPSQATLDFDCRTTAEKQACAAQVIHLRRINRLNFPGLPATQTTALTVVTNQNLYQFQLTFPSSGTPTSSIVDVQSQQPSQRSNQSDIELIQQGLQTAVAQDLLGQGDALWNRVQKLLRLTRRGTALSQATQQAGVSPQLVQRLVELGRRTTR
jgi:hypothetical protein